MTAITDNKEKAKYKARLLKALADKGVGGEKTNAEKKLTEHLAKHGLSLSDIGSAVNLRRFRTRSEENKTLLINTILSVNPFTKVSHHGGGVVADLDDEDFAEIKEKYKYFVKLYNQDKQIYMMAFFHVHKEAFQPDEYTRKKWREKYTVNEDLQIAQIKTEEINNKLSKSDMSELNKTHQAHVKRLMRMMAMAQQLTQATYIRANKTIDSK